MLKRNSLQGGSHMKPNAGSDGSLDSEHDLGRRRSLGLLAGLAGAAAGTALLRTGPAEAFATRRIPGAEPVFEIVDVTDYGAKGDGKTNDRDAIQRALDKIPPNGGVRVYFPHGHYIIDGTLFVREQGAGFVIEGAGMYASTIGWRGPAGNPMLQLADCRYATIRQLGFIAVAADADCAIESNGDAAASNLVFDRVAIDGLSAAKHLEVGVRFTPRGSDAGNDKSGFYSCYINGCKQAGVSFEHSQSKGHDFFDCVIRNTVRGVTTALGSRPVPGEGGSFRWFGGYMSNNDVDFALGSLVNNGDPIVISGMGSESSKMLLDQARGGQAARPILIEGVRWASTPELIGGNGGVVVHYGAVGTLVVMGCIFDTFAPCYIHMDPGGPVEYAARLVSIGNTLWAAPGPSGWWLNPYLWGAAKTRFESGSLTSFGNMVRRYSSGGEFGLVGDLPDRWTGRRLEVGPLTSDASGTGMLRPTTDTSVADPFLTSASQVLVTLHGDPGQAHIRWVEVLADDAHPQNSRFVIHLSAVPPPGVRFAYSIVQTDKGR
jgi:hypothetical protein